MKSNYMKNISLLIILVMLLSYSIIPVSASSDYYESTYNGYNYDCRSELYSNELYGEINYAGSSKINVETSYYYFHLESGTILFNMCTTIPSTSSVSHAVYLGPNLEFMNAYYIYNIGFNTVYTVGLIY